MSALQQVDNPRRAVFISYSSTDDHPPPDKPKVQGFVTTLYEQLAYELQNLGLPRQELWLDKRMTSSQQFVEALAEELAKSDILLAILSNGYVNSDACHWEVDYFAKLLQASADPHSKTRIFRVDKQKVSEGELPPALRFVHAIRFYEEDRQTGAQREYYWRGRFIRRRPYEEAIRTLATQIFTRLQEIRGAKRGEVIAFPSRPHARAFAAAGPDARSNGRTVFVAKPAFDLLEPYSMLVEELRGRGYAVLPDPDVDLPNDQRRALKVIRDALAVAELSIHQLGTREGFVPDGGDVPVVRLQLTEAAAFAQQNKPFHRLIWAPKMLPGADEEGSERDPLDVLAQRSRAHV